MKVTAVKPQKKGKNRFNIFIEGEFALGLSSYALEESGIYVGKELSDSEIETLKDRDQIYKAMERARKYLVTMPRSEYEVKTRLKGYGYSSIVIDSVVNHLQQCGLVDDASFASFWKNNRMEFKPRSAQMVMRELKQKGIDPQIAAQAIHEIDDDKQALKAGFRKAQSLPVDDYNEFRKKLSAYLYRRGFDYEVIGSTVERLWNEKLSEVKNGT